MKLLKKFAFVFVSAIVLLCFSAHISGSSPLKEVENTQKKQCVPTINDVEFRPDLTRVYVTLTGRPHTSYRIDLVRMLLPSGKELSFTDIDGIDAKRYFQWESDGKIDLEIDFPPVKAVNSFSLEFSGLDGEKLSASYSGKVTSKVNKK